MPEGAYIPDEFIPNKNRVGSWGLNNEKGSYEKTKSDSYNMSIIGKSIIPLYFYITFSRKSNNGIVDVDLTTETPTDKIVDNKI